MPQPPHAVKKNTFQPGATSACLMENNIPTASPKETPFPAKTEGRVVRTQSRCLPHQNLPDDAQVQEATTFCYVCNSKAVGAEIYGHLYFGELKCKKCCFTITNCCTFKKGLLFTKGCKPPGKEHDMSRWSQGVEQFLAYSAHKDLVISKFCQKTASSLSNEEIRIAMVSYVQRLLILRSDAPWKYAISDLQKIPKFGLSNAQTPLIKATPWQLHKKAISSLSGQCQPSQGTDNCLARVGKKVASLVKEQPSDNNSVQGKAFLESHPAPSEVEVLNTQVAEPVRKGELGVNQLKRLGAQIKKVFTRKRSTHSLVGKSSLKNTNTGSSAEVNSQSPVKVSTQSFAQVNTPSLSKSPAKVNTRSPVKVRKPPAKKRKLAEAPFVPRKAIRAQQKPNTGATSPVGVQKAGGLPVKLRKTEVPLVEVRQDNYLPTKTKNAVDSDVKIRELNGTPVKLEKIPNERLEIESESLHPASNISKNDTDRGRRLGQNQKGDRTKTRKPEGIKKPPIQSPTPPKRQVGRPRKKQNSRSKAQEPHPRVQEPQLTPKDLPKVEESKLWPQKLQPKLYKASIVPHKVIVDGRYLLVHPNETFPDECPDCYSPFLPEMVTIKLATCIMELVCQDCHLRVYRGPANPSSARFY